MKKTWFGEWFNSPYYHILYQKRDYREASIFIDHLISKLGFNQQHLLMDLACGKGRHSIYLNQKGFNVVGLDLSEQNIKSAKAYENQRLKFHIHDMREVFKENEFDYVLNLFTSFGYFECDSDNLKCIKAMASALKPGGSIILDFLNPHVVINQLVPEEVKVINDIEFHITKNYADGFIHKDIKFEDRNEQFAYQEKVKAITEKEFLTYFKAAGLQVEACCGNYELEPYQINKSDRMIFIAKKDIN